MLSRLTDYLRNFSLFESHSFIDLAFNKYREHSETKKFTRESFPSYIIELAKSNAYVFDTLFDNDVDEDFDWRYHNIPDEFKIDYGQVI